MINPNGDCIPIASVCIGLSFTLEFFANNCIPNVLINVAIHTTISFTNFHIGY